MQSLKSFNHLTFHSLHFLRRLRQRKIGFVCDDFASVFLFPFAPRSESVVIPHLRQFHSTFTDAIDDAMLLINSPRPPTGQRVAQRFRFADAGVRIAFDVLQQFVNPPDNPFVRLLPVLVILPSLIGEDQVHESRASLRRLPLPLASCFVAASSRRALAGLLSR